LWEHGVFHVSGGFAKSEFDLPVKPEKTVEAGANQAAAGPFK
jgi:hypothetical protein